MEGQASRSDRRSYTRASRGACISRRPSASSSEVTARVAPCCSQRSASRRSRSVRPDCRCARTQARRCRRRGPEGPSPRRSLTTPVERWRSTMPHRVRQRRSCALGETTRQPSIAFAPSESPVPAPRGTMDMPWRAAERTAACTSLVVRGRMNAVGLPAGSIPEAPGRRGTRRVRRRRRRLDPRRPDRSGDVRRRRSRAVEIEQVLAQDSHCLVRGHAATAASSASCSLTRRRVSARTSGCAASG